MSIHEQYVSFYFIRGTAPEIAVRAEGLEVTFENMLNHLPATAVQLISKEYTLKRLNVGSGVTRYYRRFSDGVGPWHCAVNGTHVYYFDNQGVWWRYKTAVLNYC